MKATLTVPPATEPLTLSEAKLHLRVDHDLEDTLIEALIVTAREEAEFRTGQRLITQTWTVTATHATEVSLDGLTPLRSITSDGMSFAVSADLPAILTVDGPGTVTIECGFGTPAQVPASIKQWLLIRIGTLYEHRQGLTIGTLSAMPTHSLVDGLLDAYTLPRC